ncbi:MAG TPA: co-chaperone GroES [Candidatus Parcubacteria bacterium]|jgi:chaperonin GroES|nr:co-chaperone GroES [Candidatus Parcubacteria bacterium]
MSKKIAIKPLGDRILVEPVEEKMTQSGIIIPETATKDKPERGTVVAVGEGKMSDSGKRIPVSVKKGQQVIFSYSEYGSGKSVKVDDKEYYILDESQILAIIE